MGNKLCGDRQYNAAEMQGVAYIGMASACIEKGRRRGNDPQLALYDAEIMGEAALWNEGLTNYGTLYLRRTGIKASTEMEMTA